MPPIRARRLRTKAKFIRRPPKQSAAPSPAAQSRPCLRNHETAIIDGRLDPVIRKPLKTYHTATRRRLNGRTKRRARKLLEALERKIKAMPTLQEKYHENLNPMAILAWLAAEEPRVAAFLLENVHVLQLSSERQADPILDAEINGLICRFSDSHVTDKPSSKENPLLEIPKGFHLVQTAAAVGGGHFDVIMHEGENYVGEDDVFKPFGGLPKPTRKSQAGFNEPGFDPVEVLRCHAISFEKTGTSRFATLETAVHPLFSEYNFHGCPQHIYDVLRPGLQLATHMLTSRSTSHFWHTLLFGERIPFAKNGDGFTRISSPLAWTESNDLTFRSILAGLVNSLHFNFSLWPTHRHEGTWTYGSMHPIRDFKRGFHIAASDTLRKSRICLHSDFYITAKRLSLIKSPDPAMVLRFNFFIAINICHELAHFFEMSSANVHFREIDPRPYVQNVTSSKEAYMFDQPWSEAGYAFETRVFGGLIKPISVRVDCLHGLTTYDEPDPDRFAELCHTRTFYTISMEFISMMQQEQTWNQDWGAMQGDDAWKVFHVPRDGATAVRVPYFDMTVWKDELDGNVISDRGRTTPFRREMTGIVRN